MRSSFVGTVAFALAIAPLTVALDVDLGTTVHFMMNARFGKLASGIPNLTLSTPIEALAGATLVLANPGDGSDFWRLAGVESGDALCVAARATESDPGLPYTPVTLEKCTDYYDPSQAWDSYPGMDIISNDQGIASLPPMTIRLWATRYV
ncbi:hypothetical protein BD311DRAFT_868547 [Dichomitus squalens]|uniref:Ricin B lectin domain-containing protein n=1 Tax=Dichomitus squalens TaxID=114155 RepID=A0A4Q9MCU8_9APHY|nr:hypothetical protein BD311DRAFT_868547 [Dichomitus squalens]